MLGTILAWIGYIILGAGIVIGAVFGAAYFVAKEINAGHGQGCSCPACQARRQRQWRARHPAAKPGAKAPSRINPDRTPGPWHKDRKLPTSGLWVSTLDLRPGTQVMAGTGVLFKVVAVTPIQYGFMVVLVSELSGNTSRIPVKGDMAHKPIWLVRIRRGTTE